MTRKKNYPLFLFEKIEKSHPLTKKYLGTLIRKAFKPHFAEVEIPKIWIEKLIAGHTVKIGLAAPYNSFKLSDISFTSLDQKDLIEYRKRNAKLFITNDDPKFQENLQNNLILPNFDLLREYLALAPQDRPVYIFDGNFLKSSVTSLIEMVTEYPFIESSYFLGYFVFDNGCDYLVKLSGSTLHITTITQDYFNITEGSFDLTKDKNTFSVQESDIINVISHLIHYIHQKNVDIKECRNEIRFEKSGQPEHDCRNLSLSRIFEVGFQDKKYILPEEEEEKYELFIPEQIEKSPRLDFDFFQKRKIQNQTELFSDPQLTFEYYKRLYKSGLLALKDPKEKNFCNFITNIKNKHKFWRVVEILNHYLMIPKEKRKVYLFSKNFFDAFSKMQINYSFSHLPQKETAYMVLPKSLTIIVDDNSYEINSFIFRIEKMDFGNEIKDRITICVMSETLDIANIKFVFPENLNTEIRNTDLDDTVKQILYLLCYYNTGNPDLTDFRNPIRYQSSTSQTPVKADKNLSPAHIVRIGFTWKKERDSHVDTWLCKDHTRSQWMRPEVYTKKTGNIPDPHWPQMTNERGTVLVQVPDCPIKGNTLLNPRRRKHGKKNIKISS